MKKYLALSLISIIYLVLLPTQVLAVDFEIKNTQIDAYLQENGDVEVIEQHTYLFDGDFNGITRSLIAKKNTTIDNVEASENNNPLEIEQDEELYKIFRSGSDEQITVDLSYTIKNGVEVYSDLGQFYWPFFDSSNESTYKNMDIFVHPPSPTEDVLAVGYDQAQATAQAQTDGIVQFAMGEVDSEENGNIRVAYDAQLFPGAAVTNDTLISEDILADISAVEEKIAAFENRKDILSNLAPYIVGGLTIYLLSLLIAAWRNRRMTLWEVERNSLQNSLLPKEEMSLPAIIFHLRGGIIQNGEILSASLMNLVRKGFVERKGENEFTVVNSNTSHEHEGLLVNWLFYKIGSDGTFSISDLEKYMENEKNQTTYYNDFTGWIKALKEEPKQHKLFEMKKTLRWTTAIIGILLIPVIVLFGIHELLMWMSFSILLSLGLVLFASFYQPRTIKGARIKQQWKRFSSNYENINQDQWNDWISDQQMQSLIYGLGTNNKTIIAKNKKLVNGLSESTVGLGSSSNDMVMFMLIAGTVSHQFNQADQTVSAATGGTTAGGGTGVGGGGGGSGAF
ncbi:DUF2207 domain-containing protein [Aquibacillus saliphilus]|uniref:DUF2207 domain-containing protein n=1 Tax=Aquibacillus saliphilus TaxID=1909422 RepID=UPI001CF03347|nr:DUF2207 domain-containing protein [Aquibacillus saliphilus]